MARSFVKDMTHGSEFRLLIGFAVPMLIGNIFQQFYNMVDSIVVGKWGVWLATALTWFVTGIISFIRYKLGKWKNLNIIKK